jgi:metal-responsive CopG/Arc/MetJ family transcriptional regulator
MEHRIPISISFAPAVLAELDDHARRQGLTRSEFVRQLFEAWLSYTKETEEKEQQT